MGRIGSIIYVVIGVIVAASKGYLGDIGGLGDFVNLLLAVLLWPLLFLGVDFNIRIGGKGGDRKGSMLPVAPVVAYARSMLASAAGKGPRRSLTQP